ncbi:MAG: beta-N-acetylglucosaminidase domain-containing protein [Myxococcota bacterium]
MSEPSGPFRHRGVVEGFYGTPWSHAERLACLERMGAWGMNRYVYAPKEDPLHRARWREAYPRAQQDEFAELVARGDECGVQAGFALSPGLSIEYASRDDRRAVCEKLGAFRALGARFFCLALDDVPSELVHAGDRAAFASLAAAHVALAHELLASLGAGCTLWLVPTDYLGVEPTDYLAELGRELAPEIEVGWTGRTVLSPTIEAREARARSETLGRPLLLWDNTPVSDGPMRHLLHLNPYTGRDPGLVDHASGVLLNPMQHPRASGVTLRSAADWLADPTGYDPEAAFDRACEELGRGAPEAFRCFAAAHRCSPLAPDDRDRALEDAVAALRGAIDAGGDARPALDALRRALAERAGAADTLRERLADRRLAAEIEPWLVSHGRETRRMAAAVDLLERLLDPDARASDRVLGFFGFEARLSREEPCAAVSYGPRRAVYPQLTSMRGDAMALPPAGGDPVLLRDRCLADELVALAEDAALARLSDRSA